MVTQGDRLRTITGGFVFVMSGLTLLSCCILASLPELVGRINFLIATGALGPILVVVGILIVSTIVGSIAYYKTLKIDRR